MFSETDEIDGAFWPTGSSNSLQWTTWAYLVSDATSAEDLARLELAVSSLELLTLLPLTVCDCQVVPQRSLTVYVSAQADQCQLTGLEVIHYPSSSVFEHQLTLSCLQPEAIIQFRGAIPPHALDGSLPGRAWVAAQELCRNAVVAAMQLFSSVAPVP